MAWPPRKRSTLRLATLLLTPALLLARTTPPARAADPQPYTVTLPPTGDAPLDAALKDTSSLVTLREKALVGPFALLSRAREDAARLQTALGSFGYYDAKVAITVAGKPTDDPTLPDTLEAARATVPVDIAITRGPLFHLGTVAVTGTTDPALRAQAERALALTPGTPGALTPGAPARAADVLAGQARILSSLRDTGHALATVATPAATLVPGNDTLNVAYAIDPGPRVDIGPITVSGLQRVDPAFVRRRLTLHDGEQFDPAKIEAARQDLASLGVFDTVRTRAADKLAPNGELPIEFDVTERKRHVVGATAAYSTDLGASAGVTFKHRNLFGEAEQLNLGAAITNLGGSASRRPGYDVTASLLKPDVLVRDQSVTVSLEGIKESLDAYDRTALLAGVTVARKISPDLSVNAGLQAQQSRITQEFVTRDYTLVGLPLGLKYDTTGPDGLLNPSHGYKAALAVTPTESLRDNAFFTILQLGGSTYVNLADPGRSVIALRATLGTIQGASTFQVPPDQRFYAGGSGTVRGYKYQSVGPRFADNRPTGGTSLAAATVEYRQRIGDSYGFAVFADAGQVSQSSAPSGQLLAGVGIGARYYTAIGPIRLDVAIPLNRRPGDDSFELYIGIGQSF